MTLLEWLKSIFKRKDALQQLSENPQDNRFDLINNIEQLREDKLKEYKIWYIGDSDELLNFYTNKDIIANNHNPVYNRNKPYYFWGINPKETSIKRVHSGLPKVIVDTLCNVIGTPEISVEDPEINEKLQYILENNTFNVILNQQARPLTLVEGDGAFKVIIDNNLCDYPLIQYYEGENVEFLYKKGICTGILYKDYYEYQNKKYILVETRTIEDDGAKIMYSLFLNDAKTNEGVHQVPLNTIPELADLPEEGLVLSNFKELLGVPTRYYYDVQNKEHGRSIFQGKLDIFDDLDQALSQASQTCRVSTPVEYIPEDLLEHGANGEVVMPSVYNRQFLRKANMPNGDGGMDTQIQVTQPQLNFQMYSDEEKDLLSMGCAGILSIPTLGMDISKKDNAEAQREKEKVTIMTRNNVIDMETSIIKKLCNLVLAMKEYMDEGVISVKKFDVSVKYNEFANPSFESLSEILSPMYGNGSISTEMYVNKLYGDSLSDEEKAKEIEWLENKANQDNLQMGDFDLDGIDTNEAPILAGGENEEEENPRQVEKQVPSNNL